MSAEAKTSTYRGWKSLELRNGLIEVQVVPDIGGRIIQLKLDDFEYFWVNDQLAGKAPTPSGLGPEDSWLNYGGSKLWPAPQGWEREDQWPGPPDAVLDGSPHAGSILIPNGKSASVQVISQRDKRSGMQFTRTIKIWENAARVSIGCKMENIDNRLRRWGIWQVTQHNAANRTGPGFDENIRVYCPINPKSMYPKGYNIIYGRTDNPEFKAEKGMMQAKYSHLVGKIGMDCSAGWYAFVNGTLGYVFVERFKWEAEGEYPDGASFELWTQGAGTTRSWGKEVTMPDSVEENPYLLETETLSPFAQLKPGQSSYHDTDWYMAKIGADLPVVDCTEVGVTCQPLRADVTKGKLSHLGGHFGVFQRGEATLALIDTNGKEIARGKARVSISPKRPLISAELSELGEGIQVPPRAVQLSLIVLDDSGKTLGRLASTEIPR
jgi:hypothetical protein